MYIYIYIYIYHLEEWKADPLAAAVDGGHKRQHWVVADGDRHTGQAAQKGKRRVIIETDRYTAHPISIYLSI